MISILIVTHGYLCEGLIKSSELIIGKEEKLSAISLCEGDDNIKFRDKIKSEINELDDGSGVLVLTDLFGGTPSNSVAANMKNLNFECITGVNLPILIEALSSRKQLNLGELVKSCLLVGNNSIFNLREKLNF